MNRVEEAMRRAGSAGGGEGAATPVTAGVPLFPADGGEAPQWASEPDAAAPRRPDGVTKMARAAADRGDEGPVHEGVFEAAESVPEKLVLSPETETDSIEQYRRLAARLHLAQAEHGIKVVMIASALPSEGKTLTATNLALTLSESYHRKVLLIDGDLRRPSIHEMFRVGNVAGLNDGLRSGPERKVPLVRWSDHLTLITAGRPDSDPMKVLISEKMQKVIAEGSASFEWVIIDTPPVGLLTDASLFSAMVDTAVLVVQAGRTPHADVQRAIQSIGRERIFGVVLNRTEKKRQKNYAYEYRYAPQPAGN